MTIADEYDSRFGQFQLMPALQQHQQTLTGLGDVE